MSKIQWTDVTWNPVVGCDKVSPGCANCYAVNMANRLQAMGVRGYDGVVARHKNGMLDWTGKINLVPERLDLPLRWRKPRRVFVNSESDLFHEDVPDGFIEKVLLTIAHTPQHTFQVLTKRPERVAGVLKCFWYGHGGIIWCFEDRPLPNVWLGVSVENQATADERIPLLLQTPAAVRWVSYEPALEAVDFGRWLSVPSWSGNWDNPVDYGEPPLLDWFVIGGESGPRARPFDLAWARSAIAECRAAGVPVFVKQLGAKPIGINFGCDRCEYGLNYGSHGLDCGRFRDRKGGDMAEWPDDLRVREWPQ